MRIVYIASNGTIASGPHALQSAAIRRATSCGNPELLSEADLLAAGVVPEVLPTLSAGQGYGDPVLAEDGLSVSRPVVDLPAEVPAEVTMRQARLALLGAGYLAQVEAAIDALPEPQRTAARIEWEHSQTVQRRRGLVVQLAAALGLDDAALDALFVAGAAIP